jgi:hypothetical protein
MTTDALKKIKVLLFSTVYLLLSMGLRIKA